jgi:4-amino-4-deoxy-L-arabinose transferase-like glycosyltransferase
MKNFVWVSRSSLEKLAILLVFILGTGIRLFQLQEPPLDFHLTRQLRSALIARAVYYQLKPDFSAQLVKQATDLANLEIYEPPVFENIVGFTYTIVGGEYVWIARIYLAIFWALGGLALLGLLRRYASMLAGLVALSFYFFLPFSVIASRSFQPDPWMVMWILVSAYAFSRWSDTLSWKWAASAGLSGGLACLIKAVAACFIGPMAVLVVLSVFGFKKWARSLQVWMMAALVALPAGIFYLAINTQRSGNFMSFWTGSLITMIFTSHFYAEWLAMIQSLFSLFPLLLALLGLVMVQGRSRWLLCGLWIGYFLYGLIFPYQYTTHEYYQLPLVGLISLSIAPVVDAVLEKLGQQHWVWRAAAGLCIVFAAFYSFYVARSVMVARNYDNEPKAWKRIGDAIPPDSRFVAITSDYGMRLRYYGWRTMSSGWPTASDENLFALAGRGGIDDYESYFKSFIEGKDLFVVLAFNELDNQPKLKGLLAHYPIYSQGDGYLIYDLNHPLK